MKAKPPKYLSWENVTDELVTTDEWDARRYD